MLGYLTLPLGLEILIGFTPADLTNLVEFNDYLIFFTRSLLVFGIAFEIPVFVVMLNLAGVIKGKSLGAHRPWIIVGTFVFAAVATPSGDPFTMTFMAVPMVLLFLVSEVIARAQRPASRQAQHQRRAEPGRGIAAVSDPDPRTACSDGRRVRPAGVARHRPGDLVRGRPAPARASCRA